MARATANTETKKTGKGGLTPEMRRNRYISCILGALLIINPLILYRFSSIKDNLMINNLFDFTSIWQKNPIGGSWVELLYWTVIKMPGAKTILGMNLPWQGKAILGILIAALTIYFAYAVFRLSWLALSSFNKGWAFITFLKQTVMIAGPVVVIMLALNWIMGTTFSVWTVGEIIFWLVPIIAGTVVAAGLCWNFDNRKQAGLAGVNVTAGDESPDNIL